MSEKPVIQSTPSTRDVLSQGSGPAGSSSFDEQAYLSDDRYAQLGEACFMAMGIATSMAQAEYDKKFAKIAALVGARTKQQRTDLEIALTYFFGAHGTSPETPWSTLTAEFIYEGRSTPPKDLVDIIGSGRIKQFCARYTKHVPRLYAQSVGFQKALAERAARLGVDPDKGYLVVDFFAKDGSVDGSTMIDKAQAKNMALQYRAANVVGVMTQSRGEAAQDRVSRPAVIPMGLQSSFRDPARG